LYVYPAAIFFFFFYLFPFWNFIKQFMWGTRIQGNYLASLWGFYS
jgi:hypothetical protein